MGKWVKCSEKMPEGFTDVLVTDGSYVEIATLLGDGSWLVLLEEWSTCVSVSNITQAAITQAARSVTLWCVQLSQVRRYTARKR